MHGLDEGMAWISEHSERPESFEPGLYESRLADVFASAGELEKCLQLSQAAYLKDPSSTTIAIDLANREARYGCKDRAGKVLAAVELKGLSPPAEAFLAWTRALVSEQTDPSSSVDHFKSAMEKLARFSSHPLVKAAEAGCAIDLALALHRGGQIEQATTLYDTAWPLAKHHCDVLTHREVLTCFQA